MLKEDSKLDSKMAPKSELLIYPSSANKKKESAKGAPSLLQQVNIKEEEKKADA
jgi:hypothetical protein